MSLRNGSARGTRPAHRVRIAESAEARLRDLPAPLRERFHRMVAGILELLEIAPLPFRDEAPSRTLRFALSGYTVLYTLRAETREVVVDDIVERPPPE